MRNQCFTCPQLHLAGLWQLHRNGWYYLGSMSSLEIKKVASAVLCCVMSQVRRRIDQPRLLPRGFFRGKPSQMLAHLHHHEDKQPCGR